MDSLAANAYGLPGSRNGSRAGTGAAKKPRPENDPIAKLLATSSSGLRQPNTWTGILIFSLAVIVIWQHPIARGVGTAAPAVTDAPGASTAMVAAPAVVTPVKPATVGTRPDTAGLTARNPFSPLVTATGTTTAPTTTAPTTIKGTGTGKGSGSSGSSKTGAKGSASASCANPYVVRSGESLWSISADQLSVTGYSDVSAAWHALYSANRDTVGANPSYLAVGERLCLPTAS